jgi:hypothetical protein
MSRVGNNRWSSKPALVVIALAVCLAAWIYWSSHRTVRFEEEVTLSNGTVIVVKRLVKLTPLGELGGPGGWESRYNRLRLPKTSSGELPAWESGDGLVPMLVDRDPSTGDWVLVATFYTCETWYLIGRPKLPYAQFRLHAGEWKRVPLSDALIGRDANVYTDAPLDLGGHLLTLNEKRIHNTEIGIAASVLKVVDRWTTTC